MIAVAETTARLSIHVSGAVQGVGFRPFVYRLARDCALTGIAFNCASGVVIEVEGGDDALRAFTARLPCEYPPVARITGIEVTRLDPAGYEGFRILPSRLGEKNAAVLPDLATCAACCDELFDPRSRRFHYPFTNCTLCGPRFSIIEAIPYDRPNTTMRDFRMCRTCQAEYEDPQDRRFHAQPNACPECGPTLELVGPDGRPLIGSPLEEAAKLIGLGQIVALKGIGGFQLLADATNTGAVQRLRHLKRREEKPFAVMFPGLPAVRDYAEVDPVEEALLSSVRAPIVLLRSRSGSALSPDVSMSSPYVGAMIPYSPLHHLLLAACKHPVVATSGNLSDEPICTDNSEALNRLRGIADAFLWHDRPIARPCDDSVSRVMRGQEMVLRRARGYAPLPVRVPAPLPRVLAVGAHLKNSVAIAIGQQVFLSQHVGDLDTLQACGAFRNACRHLWALYDFEPELAACDLHPDYFSTQFAEGLSLPVTRVQHHHAHVAACAAENEVHGAYLGVAWDGTGLGLDGTIWGGEFFLCEGRRFTRIAHLRPFRLPGGDAAIQDCRRSALSVMNAVFDRRSPLSLGITEQRSLLLTKMIRSGVNAPWTSSMGRLFDAVAAITGVAVENKFEGQAAMRLESAISTGGDEDSYPAAVEHRKLLELDWRPMIEAIAGDISRRVEPGDVARRFHNTLAEWVLQIARHAGLKSVVLSGGVFQNAYLTEQICSRLEECGFQVYTHQRVPPNDGGIALGQAVLAGLGYQEDRICA